MKTRDLIVLFIVMVVLGISTGFVTLDFANSGFYIVSLISIFYKGYTGGPGGDAGTGNEGESTS